MRIIAFLLLLTLVFPLAESIGISPPKAEISFTPNGEGAFDVLLLSSRPHSIDTISAVSGDLSQYFTVTEPSIGAQGRSSATITYEFPEDISPGMHRQIMAWKEDFFNPDTGGTAAVTEVKMILNVWKPYPGRYVELRVEPEHVKEGEDTQAKVTVYSRGDQPVKGDLELFVYDSEENLIDVWNDEDIEIDADTSRVRYFQIFSAKYSPGKYTVRAKYGYQGGVADQRALLIVGTKSVEIVNATLAVYLDKDVNRIDVWVRSLWNEELEDVSTVYKLGSSSSQSPDIVLTPFTLKKLTSYWETDRSLVEGKHTALVTGAFAGGDAVSLPIEVDVFLESPRIEAPEKIILLGMSDAVFFITMIGLLLFFSYKFMHRK